MSNGQKWYAAMVAKGHTPRMNDSEDGGGIDMFAISSEWHNGPMCDACGWSCCEHCTGIEKIPDCTEDARAKWAQIGADYVARQAAPDMLAALEAADKLIDNLWQAVPWGKTSNLDIAALNLVPGQIKAAIKKAKGT